MAEIHGGESSNVNFQALLCPGLLEPSESTSLCPLLTPSPSNANICTSNEQGPDPESISTCPLLESPTDVFNHPLDSAAGLAYQQRSSDHPDYIGVCDEINPRRQSLPSAQEGNRFALKRGSAGVTSILDSSSSSSSGLHDNPACVQLLSSYQHLDKSSEGFPSQENGAVCLELNGGKVGADYCFVHWNWPVIRTACFWSALSITVACFCIVVGMIATVPKKCLPPRGWYQGTVFYEIFPASFQDSDYDGIGDIRGVASRTEYFKSLGVSAIRLNSIFSATHYPEAFTDIQNLTSIDKHLGKLDDFKYLLTTLHGNNISVIIDLPIYPLVKSLKESRLSKINGTKKNVTEEITNVVHNHRSHRDVHTLVEERSFFSDRKSMLTPYIDGGISGLMKVTSQHLKTISKTLVEEAVEFWFGLGVDGIYIKGLEHYIHDPQLLNQLTSWANIKDSHSGEAQKILMADHRVLSQLSDQAESQFLKTFDLLDVFLELSNGTRYMADEIEEFLQSALFTEKVRSWLHWNIGSVDTRRLSSRVSSNMGAITFQALLPGTISIFYGDENGLSEVHLTEDHQDLQHLHHLAPMEWVNDNSPFTPQSIIPWIPRGYADHTPVVSMIRTISELRQSVPSIFMNKVCKDGKALLNTAIGYVDDSLIVIVRSYPRRFVYAVYYNADVKDIDKDLNHVYYGGMTILDSSSNTDEERYIKFKSFTLKSGAAVIVKLDK